MSMSSTSKLIAAFVLLIIGIVFVAQIATLGQTITDTTGVVEESHVLTTESGRNVSAIKSALSTKTNVPTDAVKT